MRVSARVYDDIAASPLQILVVIQNKLPVIPCHACRNRALWALRGTSGIEDLDERHFYCHQHKPKVGSEAMRMLCVTLCVMLCTGTRTQPRLARECPGVLGLTPDPRWPTESAADGDLQLPAHGRVSLPLAGHVSPPQAT